MTLYALKPQFQAWLRPVASRLRALGATANQLTLGACAVSVALGVLLSVRVDTPALFLLLPFWFFLRMALNALDGMLAREFGQASPLGAYLNELTDVVSDAALYLPFAFLTGSSAALVLLVIFLSALCELAGVMGAACGGQRRNDGPMGKSDRAAVFGAAGLMVGLGVAAGAWLGWTLGIVALLIVATLVNRVKRGLAATASRTR